MPVMMIPVAGGGSQPNNVRVQLDHVRLVRTNRANVAALFPALAVGEELWRKDRLGARGASKDDVCVAHVFLDDAVVLAVLFAEKGEAELGIRCAEMCPFIVGVDLLHEGLGTGEGAVDNVYMVDLGASQDEGKPDVPVSLGTGAKDGDGMNGGAFHEEDGGGQGRAECG